MSTSPTPPSPSPADENLPADPAVAPAGPSFEEKLHLFWKNNQKAILGFCVVVLLVITAKGVWEWMQIQRENSISGDYAKAVNSEQLKKFAAEHEGHALAGVAYLRLADEAYAAGKYAEAGTNYGKAGAALKNGPLAARATLGAAVAKVLAGDLAGGETALKAVAADLNQPTSARAEATYHLATLAYDRGDAAASDKYLEQITTIEPQGLWAQRAAFARATRLAAAPAQPAAPAVAPGESKITFPTQGK